MAESKAGPKPWTEAEKVELLFQIIEMGGPIPWDALKLPAGRTKKAVQVMIDKEKTKMKKARAADGSEDDTAAAVAATKAPETPKKKRKATDEAGGSGKKTKTPRKKKAKAGKEEEDQADGEEDGAVKAESGSED